MGTADSKLEMKDRVRIFKKLTLKELRSLKRCPRNINEYPVSRNFSIKESFYRDESLNRQYELKLLSEEVNGSGWYGSNNIAELMYCNILNPFDEWNNFIVGLTKSQCDEMGVS